MMNIRYLVFLFVATLFTHNSYAALPISECKSFLDEELEMLCLKSSIEAKIEDEIPFYHGGVKHSYADDDIEFRSNYIVIVAPDGEVVYDIHLYKSYPYFGHSHLYNPFMDRVFEGESLSDDHPDLTLFEIRVFTESGFAHVSLKKLHFESDEIFPFD